MLHPHDEIHVPDGPLDYGEEAARAMEIHLWHAKNDLLRRRNGHAPIRPGYCDECERMIPVARLMAVPDATLCVRCQEKAERA